MGGLETSNSQLNFHSSYLKIMLITFSNLTTLFKNIYILNI